MELTFTFGHWVLDGVMMLLAIVYFMPKEQPSTPIDATDAQRQPAAQAHHPVSSEPTVSNPSPSNLHNHIRTQVERPTLKLRECR